MKQGSEKKTVVIALWLLPLLLTGSCKSDRPQVPEGRAHTQMVRSNLPSPFETEEGVTFRKIDDAVFDRKHMTQISITLLLNSGITRANVERLLWKFYHEAAARGGFQYHPHATDVYVYAFVSQEHISSDRGQWLAMISKTPADPAPALRFDEAQLAGLADSLGERFGLNGDQRKKIFLDLMVQREMAQSMGGDTNQWRDSLAQQYGVRRADLDSVVTEGSRKHWALPPMPQNW